MPKSKRIERHRVELPPKLLPVFSGDARYRCAYGGRGSAKSRSFALMLAIKGIETSRRILCVRELQNSIKDSVLSEVVSAIEDHPWLADHYEWGESFLRGRHNQTEFIFKGLRTNYREIKSMSRIDLCWAEEAEAISDASWNVLIPTIRQPGSEIWVTWNPESTDSYVHKRFVLDPPNNAKVASVNWRDNPWFPDVLDAERRDCLERMPDRYHHIWEGECITRSDAQILAGKWVVREFEPGKNWDPPLHGADWGYASDPTAAIRAWIHDDRLWIEYESYAHRLELNDVAARWRRDIPGIEHYALRADSAQPAMISHVKRELPKIIGAPKWNGSIEDGIAYLRSFREIVIHPRCTNFVDEARRYSYKVDRRTGDILPVIVDAHNHCLPPDAMIATAQGLKRIDSVTTHDHVLTRAGFKPVLWSGRTDVNRQLYQLTTKSGKTLKATGDHKIFTQRGFVPMDTLRYDDRVLILDAQWYAERQQFTGESLGIATLIHPRSITAGITDLWQQCLGAWIDIFTAKCGLITMGLFPKVCRFTTKITTLAIIQLKTWSVLQCGNTWNITRLSGNAKTDQRSWNTWNELGHLQKRGIRNHQRGVHCTKSWRRTLPKRIATWLKVSAISVARSIKSITCHQAKVDFALMPVSPNGAGITDLMTWTSPVQCAESQNGETNTHGLKLAVDYVDRLQIVEIAPQVYDLTIADQHEFFANGVLVHNCVDSLRYALSPLILAKSGKQHTPKFSSERSAANTRERIGGVKRDGRVFQ